MKEIALAVCFACHGEGGVSQTPLTPSIAGQPAFYTMAQLFLFREGRRDNAPMTAAAKGLTDADLRSIADRLEKLPPPKPPATKPDPARLARGRAIAEERKCAGCHGNDYSGGQNVPRLAGQREDYLLKSLRDYRESKRVGYGLAVMPETVAGLSEQQLGELALLLSGGGR